MKKLILVVVAVAAIAAGYAVHSAHAYCTSSCMRDGNGIVHCSTNC
jgi:hypothetical protein